MAIDAAKKVADALNVSLDFLVGEIKTLQRMQEMELLADSKKETLFDCRCFYRKEKIKRCFK